MIRLRKARSAVVLGLVGALTAVPSVPALGGSLHDFCTDTRGPATCTWWKATITEVIDGDTFRAKAEGDGLGEITVRMIGINTTEVASGSRATECHALEATRRLETLIARSSAARIGAEDRDSIGGNNRYLRYLRLRIDGHWIDAGLSLLASGHALWLSKWEESTNNFAYFSTARAAPAGGEHLWDPAYCRSGPHQGSDLQIRVQPDENGPESDPLTGEMIEILNHNNSVDVALGGWSVRDSSNRHFTIPQGTALRAGDRLNIGIGRRSPAVADLVWEPGSPTLFTNPRYPWSNYPGPIGDGAYLFDPDGDLRAHFIYPVKYDQSTPTADLVQCQWHVTETGAPRLAITSLSATRSVDLDGTYTADYEFTYTFWSRTIVSPGETLYVEVTARRGSVDTPLTRYWYAPGIREPYEGQPAYLHTFDQRLASGITWVSGV